MRYCPPKIMRRYTVLAHLQTSCQFSSIHTRYWECSNSYCQKCSFVKFYSKTDLFKIEHIGVVSSLARHLQLHDVVSDRNRCQDGGHPDLVPDCNVQGKGREGSCRSETILLSPKMFDNLLVNTYQENSDSLQERWWRWLVSEGSRKEEWSDTGQLW